MNGELRDILKANIGRIVRIYFHGIGDDTYGSGVIKEVTNSILTFELRIREGSGVEYDTVTYHDIGQIRTVTSHEYRATRRHVRSVRKRTRAGQSTRPQSRTAYSEFPPSCPPPLFPGSRSRSAV